MLLAIDCRLLVAGYWSLAVDRWSLLAVVAVAAAAVADDADCDVVYCWLLVVGCWLSRLMLTV